MPGPIIVSVSTDPGGGGGGGGAVTPTSLTALRRELAWRVGPHTVAQTTTGAEGPDNLRALISSTLRDPNGNPSKFDRRYLYITTGDNAGISSRVFTGGFDGLTGTVLVSQPYVEPVASGTTFELSEPLPAVSDGDLFGLNDAIRLALFHLYVFIDLDYTAVDRQIRYGITNLPWTVRREEVVGIYQPLQSGYTAAQSYPQMLNPACWDFEYDGESPYLVIPQGFTAGETFYVRVRRPAATWVNVGGTWGSSDTGPTNEDDEVVYDAHTVAATALPICLRRLVEHYRSTGQAEQAAIYEGRLADTELGGAMTRWYRSFRGNGRQRVGATSGGRGRSWWDRGY